MKGSKILKVLFIYENDIATVKILRDLFVLYSEERNINISFKTVMKVCSKDIVENDVLFMIRPNCDIFFKIANKFKKLNKIVILYSDDELLNLPNGCPDMPWRKKGMMKAIKSCNIIVSSNKLICEKYKKINSSANIFVLNTPVENSDLSRAKTIVNNDKKNKQKIKIIYAASGAHTKYFDKYIYPIIPKLCDKYKDKISFTFMGVHPQLNKYEKLLDVTYYDSLPLHEYRKNICEGNYDIGLAPIDVDEFSRCKYYNKFIEYSLAGIVGIYTNTEPYNLIVEDKINGLLSKNTPEEWFETIAYAIDNSYELVNYKKNAIITLENRCSKEKIFKDIDDGIVDLLVYKENNMKTIYYSLIIYKLVYLLNRIMDCIYKYFYFNKKYGIKYTVKRIKGFLKRVIN